MSDSFTVRTATVADAPILARHRAEMFRDMGVLPEHLLDVLVDASRRYFEELAARATPASESSPARYARGLYEKLGFVPTNEMRFAGRRQS